MKKYENCKWIFCMTAGGEFYQGETYPLYQTGGYSYVALFDVAQRKPVLFPLDCFEDDTYKVVGTWDEFENAEFKEVYF